MSSPSPSISILHNLAHIALLEDNCSSQVAPRVSENQSNSGNELKYERAQDMLGNSNGIAWVALHGKAVRGFAVLNRLVWDSNQLGVPAARLDYLIAKGSYSEQHEIKENLLNEVLDEAFEKGIWHVSVRLDSSDLSGLHVLENAGFITVDNILTFAKELAAHRRPETSHAYQIRLATPADANRVADLARQSYIYDRFHSDPYISSKCADELHSVWLRNSCEGTAADAVVIAEDNESLLGFVTCKLQGYTETNPGRMFGTIVLVATAEHAHGTGVGYSITMAALEWFRDHGTAVVEVGTQLRNIRASRLYQKCGFGFKGSSVSLRKLL